MGVKRLNKRHNKAKKIAYQSNNKYCGGTTTYILVY